MGEKMRAHSKAVEDRVRQLILDYENKLMHGAGSGDWMLWCERAYRVLKELRR